MPRNRAAYSVDVIRSDAFTDMSYGAQALYFQLLADADRSGALLCVKGVIRLTGIPRKYYDELVEAGFVTVSESGDVPFLTHWWCHNTQSGVRYLGASPYEELSRITIGEPTTEVPQGYHGGTTEVPRSNHRTNKKNKLSQVKELDLTNGNGGSGVAVEGSTPRPAQCPKCGSHDIDNRPGATSLQCRLCGQVFPLGR